MVESCGMTTLIFMSKEHMGSLFDNIKSLGLSVGWVGFGNVEKRSFKIYTKHLQKLRGTHIYTFGDGTSLDLIHLGLIQRKHRRAGSRDIVFVDCVIAASRSIPSQLGNGNPYFGKISSAKHVKTSYATMEPKKVQQTTHTCICI